MRGRFNLLCAQILLLTCTILPHVYCLSSQTQLYHPVRRQVAPAAPPPPAASVPFPSVTPPANSGPKPTTTPPATPMPDLSLVSTPSATAQVTPNLPPPTTVLAVISTDPYRVATPTPTVSIFINALPPAPSGHSRRRRRTIVKPLNARYLAPVFAVLGVVLGALTAWILLILRRRCIQRRREDSLEPGPEYIAPPGVTEGNRPTGGQTMRNAPWATFIANQRTSEKGSSRSNGSWFSNILHARRGGPVEPGDHPENESYSFLNEDDPFLAPTPSVTSGPSARTFASDPLGRSQLLLTTSFLSPGLTSPNHEQWEDVQYDPDRPEGVRQSVLERLKGRPKFRRGHSRADSDGNIVEANPSDGQNIKNPQPPPTPTKDYAISRSDAGGQSQPLAQHERRPGFRVMNGSEGGITLGRSSWGWVLPWVTAETVMEDDRLTPVPQRRNVTDKRKTPLIPPLSPPTAAESRPVISSQVDASVLPSSPPLAHSSPLEAQLLFAPLASIGSMPSLNSGLNQSGDGSNVCLIPYESKSAIGLKRSNRPRRKLDSSPLPYPGSGTEKSTPYRRRLTKPPPDASYPENKTPVMIQKPMSSSDRLTRSPTSASTSTVFLKETALNKVEEILAKSWSERELSGSGMSRSPTLFGALGPPDMGRKEKEVGQ